MVCEALEHLALLTCLTSLLATDLPWLTRSTPLYSVPLLMLPFLLERFSLPPPALWPNSYPPFRSAPSLWKLL